MTGNVMFHEFIKKSVAEEDTKQELSDHEDKEDIQIQETETKIEETNSKVENIGTKVKKDKKIRKKNKQSEFS